MNIKKLFKRKNKDTFTNDGGFMPPENVIDFHSICARQEVEDIPRNPEVESISLDRESETSSEVASAKPVEELDKMTETKEEINETITKASKILADIQREAISNMPIWMRLNFVLNAVYKRKDSDINWEEVNNMLKEHDKFDTNLVKNIYSIDDLAKTRLNVIAASEGLGVWQIHKCKDCGEEFYLCYGEVQYFKDRNLELPKRCKSCRQAKRAGR